jgi:hypothetical protein
VRSPGSRRLPELLERIAAAFEYLFGGGEVVEPEHRNACTY